MATGVVLDPDRRLRPDVFGSKDAEVGSLPEGAQPGTDVQRRRLAGRPGRLLPARPVL